MRIGVVGDTHDRMENVRRIVDLFREARVDRVVHTGDVTRPDVLERLAGLEVPVFGVFGNNDHPERERLERESLRLGMDFAPPPRSFEWLERRILVVHDPEEASLPASGGFDLLLHGHTHRHRHERHGQTLIFNPGECAGFMRGRNAVGLVDLVSLEATRLRF
ncbi:MAG TPA: YfcE family phosphodiesterase [Deltaproteobacteria bacterium]|nr:YfcE family phosphodiesterase [Deltaproteobacteria bacterium]